MMKLTVGSASRLIDYFDALSLSKYLSTDFFVFWKLATIAANVFLFLPFQIKIQTKKSFEKRHLLNILKPKIIFAKSRLHLSLPFALNFFLTMQLEEI